MNTITRTHYNCSSLTINRLHAASRRPCRIVTNRDIRVCVTGRARAEKLRTKTVGKHFIGYSGSVCLMIKLTVGM